MARPGRLPRQQARLGAEGPQGLGDEPEHPRPRPGLPDRRGRHAGLAAHVQRGRRLDDHLRRRLAARAPVGLPRPEPRRHRRRLADRLLRAAALLLPDRPRLRRVGPARRPGLPARRRGRPDAAAPDRLGRDEGRPRHDEAGLALVAGVQLDQLGRLRRPPAVRPAQHLPVGLQRGREGVDGPDPLAEGDRPRREARDRRPRPKDRDERQGPRDRRDVDRRRRQRALRERPRSSSSPRTRSGRRGCCSSPTAPATRTASRTRRASSGSG